MEKKQSGTILVTVCARKGSKGLPGKNIRPLLSKPLIAHSIEQAKAWGRATQIVFSTDSEVMAGIAIKYGADAPFLRPEHLANDTVGKLPVLTHALKEGEKHYGQKFDILVDLDVTAPIRTTQDIDNGLARFLETGSDVCFSVVKARRSPYFNMVERSENGEIRLSKPRNTPFLSRQATPEVWDLNCSIYIYKRDFLLSDPDSLWRGKTEIFEMPADTAFDIDEERDFIVVEALLKSRVVS